jgi:hypothetical protein
MCVPCFDDAIRTQDGVASGIGRENVSNRQAMRASRIVIDKQRAKRRKGRR